MEGEETLVLNDEHRISNVECRREAPSPALPQTGKGGAFLNDECRTPINDFRSF